MKLLKSLSVAMLVTAAVSTASAATIASNPKIIHIVGSTAFRAATTIAILDALHGNTAASPSGGSTTVFAAFAGTNLSSAATQIFANGTTSGASPTATIVVETAWTGSLAGVVDLVAQTSTAKFYDDTNTTVQSAIDSSPVDFSTSTTGTGTALDPTVKHGGYVVTAGSGINLATTGNTHTSTTIEMAMSDSYQGTIASEISHGATVSPAISATITSAATLATACAGSTITDAGTASFAGTPAVVAIVPFEWVVGSISTATVPVSYSDSSTLVTPTNITQEVARQFIQAGYIPQGLFTGTNTVADSSNFFFFVGRNEDSGTRIGYLQESQVGVAYANPIHWAINGVSYTDGTGASVAVSGTQEFPKNVALNTEPNVIWKNVFGHSGYASGGNVAGALTPTGGETGNLSFASGSQPSDVPGTSGTNNDCYLMSSLGLTDAATVAAAGGHILSYNGVPYTPATVQNGTYSHWEFEHCYRLASGDATINGEIDTIADLLYSNDADAVYSPTTKVSSSDNTKAVIGVYRTENSATGAYDSQYGLAPGVKFDAFVNCSRSLTEGGPIKSKF